MYQDNDDTIVQDDDYVHPLSEILDIDSLSYEDDTSSGAITNNNSIEEDLHTKSVPRNLRPNSGPRRSDAGTGVPSFEPSFKGQTYKTTNTRQKQFLTKMKKLMKTGNKNQSNTNKTHQRFLSTYKKYFESEESKTDHSYLKTETNVMFNQMSAKRGINVFK